MPYIKKYKKNPVTGESLAAKDLIRLHFHKNTEGQYICPITYKGNVDFASVACGYPLTAATRTAFSGHTRIVFIRTSGHVYSMEAIEQLNIKTNNWTVCLQSLSRAPDYAHTFSFSSLFLQALFHGSFIFHLPWYSGPRYGGQVYQKGHHHNTGPSQSAEERHHNLSTLQRGRTRWYELAYAIDCCTHGTHPTQKSPTNRYPTSI